MFYPKSKILYFFSSDFATYSKSANAYQKISLLSLFFDPKFLSIIKTKADTSKMKGVFIPLTKRNKITSIANIIGSFNYLFNFLLLRKCRSIPCSAFGFDLLSMFFLLSTKLLTRSKIIFFVWDPPGIAHRNNKSLKSIIRIKFLDYIFRRCCCSSDLVVANIHNGCLSQSGVDISRIRLFEQPNGCLLDLCYDIKSNTNSDCNQIAIQSSFSESKNKSKLYVLIANLLNLHDSVIIRWIGSYSEADKIELHDLLKSKSLDPSRVILHGRLSHNEALRTIASSGIAIHFYPDIPSLRWNYVLKMSEFMALGKCIVAVKTPGVCAYLDGDPPAGLLLDDDCPHKAAETILPLIGNKKLQDQYGIIAHHRSHAYDWQRINEATAQKILEVI